MDGQKDLLSLIDDGSRAREDHSVMMTIEQLEKQCLSCSRCSLRDGCKQVVFGAGSPEAQIMLIGEAPPVRARISRAFLLSAVPASC